MFHSRKKRDDKMQYEGTMFPAVSKGVTTWVLPRRKGIFFLSGGGTNQASFCESGALASLLWASISLASHGYWTDRTEKSKISLRQSFVKQLMGDRQGRKN